MAEQLWTWVSYIKANWYHQPFFTCKNNLKEAISKLMAMMMMMLSHCVIWMVTFNILEAFTSGWKSYVWIVLPLFLAWDFLGSFDVYNWFVVLYVTPIYTCLDHQVTDHWAQMCGGPWPACFHGPAFSLSSVIRYRGLCAYTHVHRIDVNGESCTLLKNIK